MAKNKNKNKPGIVDGYEVVVGNVDVFREILEKHKLLQKLTEKSTVKTKPVVSTKRTQVGKKV